MGTKHRYSREGLDPCIFVKLNLFFFSKTGGHKTFCIDIQILNINKTKLLQLVKSPGLTRTRSSEICTF